MNDQSLEAASNFISKQEFEPPIELEGAAEAQAGPAFEMGKSQGAIVDSNIAAFPPETPAGVRDAVSDWMLFAQLVASKKFPGGSNTAGWADEYLDVLVHTGWAKQEEVANWTEERVTGSQVHQKIMGLVAVVLGPVPTALAIVTAALRGLQQMDEDSKWITLFDRRGKSTTSVGFSIASVEPQSDGAAALRSVDFRIDAHKTMTQVLFFKFTDNEASMFRRGTVLSLAADELARLGPMIKARVAQIAAANIAAYDLD
jgi:hypothetical protein